MAPAWHRGVLSLPARFSEPGATCLLGRRHRTPERRASRAHRESENRCEAVSRYPRRRTVRIGHRSGRFFCPGCLTAWVLPRPNVGEMEGREPRREDVPPSHARPPCSGRLDPGVPDRVDGRRPPAPADPRRRTGWANHSRAPKTARSEAPVREPRSRATLSTASRRGDAENVLAPRRRVAGGASAWCRAPTVLLLCDQNVAEVYHGGPSRQA
jgi:hypothetical protein